MNIRLPKRETIKWLCALALPGALTAFFYLLRPNRAAMDAWVFGVAAPVERFLGRLWSTLPFSVAEVLVAAAIAGAAVWVVRLAVLAFRERALRPALRRLLALVSAGLWMWTALCWMWNSVYCASGFSERSGFYARPCSVEQLEETARLFARRAGELSSQVQRDAGGHFAVPVSECLDRGMAVYRGITEQFSTLDIPGVRAKPLVCSRLQSILGFTGMYFPFTGEANVNVDAPVCLLPATIAHEMAHQRMVAAEEEANFVGIAAAVTSGDVLYEYSGYLMGLIHLSNALYSADPQRWYDLRAGFPPELVTDWNDNSVYWAELSSPVEETAGKAYDSFLKGNGQSMGMRSYGACVDLLTTWAREALL